MSKPFFSVCVPVYNGGDLIINAIRSLEDQNFKDFEVIFVDNNSTDGTYEKVKNILEKSKLNYFLKKNIKTISMVRNWNETLKHAKGKYIAFLHHDDAYRPDHLNKAHKILKKYKNIGIYAVGNQITPRKLIGLMNPDYYFKYIYSMEDVSPPSETIFIKEYQKKRYFYNESALYSEMEVYFQIADDGLKAYHSRARTVFRHSRESDERVTKNVYYTWIFFVDKFRLIEYFKNHRYIGKKIYIKSLKNQINVAIKRYYDARQRNKDGANSIFQNLQTIILQKGYFLKYLKLFFRKISLDILRIKILSKLNSHLSKLSLRLYKRSGHLVIRTKI
ncbi:MAG: glycosyltransferase family 2 protein [Promethearchaeota archaeon]